jgi:hypothetical protein
MRALDLFKGRHCDQEIIVLCVRWYLRYKLSSRDLVQMMAERGIEVAHTTILRWVQRFVPEFEKRWSQYARPVPETNASFGKTLWAAYSIFSDYLNVFCAFSNSSRWSLLHPSQRSSFKRINSSSVLSSIILRRYAKAPIPNPKDPFSNAWSMASAISGC